MAAPELPQVPGVTPDDLDATFDYLRSLGLTDRDLREAIEGDFLHSAGLVPYFEHGDWSARQVAERAGVPLERIVDTYRLLGITVDDPDRPIFVADEPDMIAMLLGASDAFEDGEGDEILRVSAASLSAIAESIVSVFVGGVEDRFVTRQDATCLERTKLTQSSGEQVEMFGSLLGRFFRHHLRQAIWRQRQSMGKNGDRRLRTMAVGFVDLVGFTPLTASMSSTELVAFIRDFESRSFDIASHRGGRVVKIIGDEVMVTSLDAEVGVHIVLDLIDEFRTGDTAPRAGLAVGEVVARLGDYFGPVVNLAARLADHAVPGEVLAGEDIAARLGVGVLCEGAGRRMLKGFAEPVSVVSITRGPSIPDPISDGPRTDDPNTPG